MKGGDAVRAGMIFAAVLILPFGIFSGDLGALNWYWLIVAGVIALLTSTISFTLDMEALRQLPPKTFSILQSLQPAFGAFSGLLILREYLSLTQWISILCVIAASIGATLSTDQEKRAEIVTEVP